MVHAVRHSVLARLDRLPGRYLSAARHWVRLVATALEYAGRTARAAEAAAALGDAKQYNAMVEEYAAVVDGYSSVDAARGDRLQKGTAAWEEKFGSMADPEVRAKLEAFRRASDAEMADAARRKATPPPRRRRRKR